MSKEPDTISGVIKKNYKSNATKLCGVIGDILVSVFLALTFAMNGTFPIEAVFAILLFTLKPYVIFFLNIVFKNDIDKITTDLNITKKENELMREIYEWKCIVSARDGKVPDAIIYTNGWNDMNSKIQMIEQKLTTLNANKTLTPSQLAEEQLKALNGASAK